MSELLNNRAADPRGPEQMIHDAYASWGLPAPPPRQPEEKTPEKPAEPTGRPYIPAPRQPEYATEEPALLKFTPGGSFVQDVPEIPAAVWGNGGEVLWPEGEALMIAAPQGVGKTTVAFQLVRARLGLQPEVLGYRVNKTSSRVLYLAMDRPAQAARAAARLFSGDDREFLNEHLVIWKGPPPMDVAKNPAMLTIMCQDAGADTVIVDSLKDAAIGLSDDVVGAGYNRARQMVLEAGVQVLELHHTVKRGANGGEPNTIADVYGSVWLTSGAGSVISLFGNPGDPVVSFRHLKPPMIEVGPFRVVHDQAAGTSDVQHGVDLLELVKIAGATGLLAANAAAALFDTNKPTAAEVEKARRRLERLCESGTLYRRPGVTKTSPATYYLTQS